MFENSKLLLKIFFFLKIFIKNHSKFEYFAKNQTKSPQSTKILPNYQHFTTQISNLPENELTSVQ